MTAALFKGDLNAAWQEKDVQKAVCAVVFAGCSACLQLDNSEDLRSENDRPAAEWLEQI